MVKDNTDKEEHDVDLEKYQELLDETHNFTSDIIGLDSDTKERLKYVLIGANLKSNLKNKNEK